MCSDPQHHPVPAGRALHSEPTHVRVSLAAELPLLPVPLGFRLQTGASSPHTHLLAGNQQAPSKSLPATLNEPASLLHCLHSTF